MKTPYNILNVTEQATDTQIKHAYLYQVKQYPPDHNHELFQQVHTAYQAIKDQKSRVRYALFHYSEPDFNVLLDDMFRYTTMPVFTADSFDKLLQASIDDSIFQLSAHKTN